MKIFTKFWDRFLKMSFQFFKVSPLKMTIDTQSYHKKIAVNMQNSYSRIIVVTGLCAR